MVDKLKNSKHQVTTQQNYISIWRKFNKFVIKLDEIPPTWEERVVLYIGFLANQRVKSTTIKSYVSAIKSILTDDDYDWNDKDVKLASLTRACRITNDTVRTRLPIRLQLLEILLANIDYIYVYEKGQHYLGCLYKCIFVFGYYGLLRIGEMATGDHPVRAMYMLDEINKRY